MRSDRLFYAVILAVLVIAVIWGVRYQTETEETGEITTRATPYEQRSEFAQIEADRKVVVHCGSSMRLVMEEIAKDFQEEYNIAVQFNFGGSAELLATIEVGQWGDVYVCHDPYADNLDEKGLLRDYTVPGYLRPVVMVPQDNPHNIEDISCLKRPELQVGLTDPRYSTAGELVEKALADKGWKESVYDNVVLESRAHNELAVALVSEHIDAGVAWSFLPELYDELKSIPAGIDFPEIRVTACLLENAENQEEAENFMNFIISDTGREAFQRYGYLEEKEE